VPRGGTSVAAEARQPAVPQHGQRPGETPAPVLPVPVPLRPTPARGESQGSQLHSARCPVRVPDAGMRGSARSRGIAIFSAAIVPDAKSTSHPRSAAPVSGFVARLAVKPCGESSSASGAGGSGHGAPSGRDRRAAVVVHEFVAPYRHEPHDTVRMRLPREAEGAGGSRDRSGPPAPFLRSLHEETGR
jgi:hypothetical protein